MTFGVGGRAVSLARDECRAGSGDTLVAEAKGGNSVLRGVNRVERDELAAG